MLAPEMRRSLFFNRLLSEPLVGTGSAKAEGFHAAFTLRALGAVLLRVARIQSSATEVFTTNATANDVSQSSAFCASVGSATMSRAGM